MSRACHDPHEDAELLCQVEREVEPNTAALNAPIADTRFGVFRM